MTTKLVLLESFADSPSAHICKGQLEAAGIKCFLIDDTLVGYNPHLSIAFGGVKLKVYEKDLERAKQIIK